MIWTIYSVTADLTILDAILNGVAGICKQTAFIWGFALMVAIWNIIRAVTAATLNSGGNNAGAIMTSGSFTAVLPLILAFLLTASGLKTTVTLQSTVNGKMSAVSNVPMVIALIPASASLLSQELGALVGTAYQSVGTEYSSISASGVGFINPLKVLLTSRTAIMRLGSLDSQIRSVVGACINSDSGANYSDIIEKVRTAGNPGITSTISIKGSTNNSLSQLLQQAANNTTGFVADLNVNSTTIMSCPEAAQFVAANIEASLDTTEFKKTVQGAVNGSHQPNTATDFSYNTIVTQYAAIRSSSAASMLSAGSTQQANTEVLNLLFNEVVNMGLDCLRADGPNKTTCQASVLQALEIERANIQRAASEAQMLKFAGAFANQMMALIIGLSPILVMFMMFSGINATKSIYMAAHVITWPFLVLNVGAEIINGMIYTHVANFLASISQGGYITHSVAIEAFREFSLQVGTASHIMSSLPVLLSMIFAMGASSASVSVANKMTPSNSRIPDATSPQVQETAPLFRNSSMGNIKQLDGAYVEEATGASKFVQQTQAYGEFAKQVTASQSQEISRQKNIQAAQTFTNSITDRNSTGTSNVWGLSKDVVDRVSNNVRQSFNKSNTDSTSTSASGTRSNSTNSTIGAGAAANASVGTPSAKGASPFSASLGLSVRADAGAVATDTMAMTEDAKRAQSIQLSKNVEAALGKELANSQKTSTDRNKSHSLERALAAQKQYTESLSDTQSEKKSSSNTDQNADRMVAFSQSVASENLAQHAMTNPDFRNFLLTQGRLFSQNPEAAKKIEEAKALMDTGAVEKLGGNPLATSAAVQHNAAVRLATDKRQPNDVRQIGVDYLTKQGLAMNGIKPEFQNPTPLGVNLQQAAVNDTGVASAEQLAPKQKAAVTPRKPPKSAAAAPTPPAAVPKSRVPSVVFLPGSDEKLSRVDDIFKKAEAAGLGQDTKEGTVGRVTSVGKEAIVTSFKGERNKTTTLGN